MIASLFILSNVDLPDFAFLSKNSNINKPDIKIIYRRLGHLHNNNVMKLASMSIRLEMPNNMTQSPLSYKIYILTK